MGVFAAAVAGMPDNAPGVAVIKPWVPVINAVALALIGFTARQNNVPSEAIGVAPGQPGQPAIQPPSNQPSKPTPSVVSSPATPATK